LRQYQKKNPPKKEKKKGKGGERRRLRGRTHYNPKKGATARPGKGKENVKSSLKRPHPTAAHKKRRKKKLKKRTKGSFVGSMGLLKKGYTKKIGRPFARPKPDARSERGRLFSK